MTQTYTHSTYVSYVKGRANVPRIMPRTSKVAVVHPLSGVPHIEKDCAFCTSHATTKARGRPAGKTKRRPTSPPPSRTTLTQISGTSNDGVTGMDIQAKQVTANACSTHRAEVELKAVRFIDQNNAEICDICQNGVDSAIEAVCCQELFCATCICKWLATHATCPSCESKMVASSLVHPGRVLSRMLGNRSIHCDYYRPGLDGCPTVIPLKDLREHVQGCPFNPVSSTQQLPIRAIRPSSTVAEMREASPSKDAR